MISWNILLSGKKLSEQAYAVLSRIVDQARDSIADRQSEEEVTAPTE